MNSTEHFAPTEDLRCRHDLMVELFRVEQARESAAHRASEADLARLERQQRMISEALARLVA